MYRALALRTPSRRHVKHSCLALGCGVLRTYVFSGVRGWPLTQVFDAVNRWRPFAAMSRLLSALVPRNKCAGFTQAGTSHLWQTHKPAGIVPCATSYETRCADRFFPPNQRLWPYPLAFKWPVQSQQSSGPRLSTRAQKRSVSEARMYLFYVGLEAER
jgi:hypothetical protein